MSGNPNPYRDSGPWGHVFIGGVRVPGVIADVDGAERPEQWDKQKATEKTGASTVWKGTDLADAIKITTSLHDQTSVDEYYRLRDILRPPKSTNAPPALPIVSPIINFSGITRVAYRVMSPPKWVKSGGYWKGVITLIDFSPAEDAKTGVARVKRGRTVTEERTDPNQAIKDQFNRTVQKVKAVSQGGRVR